MLSVVQLANLKDVRFASLLETDEPILVPKDSRDR
jgi:hypothetical protein